MANPLHRMTSSSQVSTWFGQGSGNLSIPSRTAPPISVDFLVIGGGSGGFRGVVNQFDGGGGNAGGYRTSTGGLGYRGAAAESPVSVAAGGSYTVTVGAGGASSTAGSDSVFSSIVSTGGTVTGGNNGGYAGGQGSGAANSGVNGGAGTANTITGSSVTRAGGGGGAHTASGAGAAGGGNGNTGGTGGAATANTGSGGGGGRQAEGGPGGSGLVVLQYPSAYTITIGAGLTGTTATVGANKVTTFTAGTGTVSWA